MGYHRTYALRLRRHGSPVSGTGPARRPRRRACYGPAGVAARGVAAEATEWICGKRMVTALPAVVPAVVAEVVPTLERGGALPRGTISY